MQRDVTLRFCDHCGKPLPFNATNEQEGFYASGEYYCSDICLLTWTTWEEWNKLCDEWDDEYYWTTWELEEVA